MSDDDKDDIKDSETAENGSGDGDGENGSGAHMAQMGGNAFLRRMMETNFIEYASYVIKERAIPDVDDGLKPVQRRILWSLREMDDGKFHKVANVIGHCMKYHPHGDAAIGDALVVLANKEYYIDRQGNFGNILTGDEASAARYIECRLTQLSRETLFNNSITIFTESYDGRNKEPVVLPAKIPSLLMLGADGIAVGMATKIFQHNFVELLEAQIAILEGRTFQIYPDFPQGGMMDVSEYADGAGKIVLRAKIELDGRRLIIREIPAMTTTEKLIESIEKQSDKGKIKIASINDFTAENIEIEITPMRGYDPQKAMQALYAYTDCSISARSNLTVICDNKPAQLTVSEILTRNTARLLEYLRLELELDLAALQEKFHEKTLAQIFIENRIYKRIEECESYELVISETLAGLAKFRRMLKRDVTREDVEKLLSIQIRRISLFDINKNKEELDNIVREIARALAALRKLKAHAIKYLRGVMDKYGRYFPRKTEIETFDKIDRHAVALNNIKVGWDRKGGYIGTAVKSEDQVTCNEFDHLLCIEKKGKYKVINIPDKLFIDKLFEFRKFDKETELGIIYRDTKTNKCYAKRCVIDKFITDKEYRICPEGCVLELVTPRPNSVYELTVDTRIKASQVREFNMLTAPVRSAKARGLMITTQRITKITWLRCLEGEELEEFLRNLAATQTADDDGEGPELPDIAEDTETGAGTEEETSSENEDGDNPQGPGEPAEEETPARHVSAFEKEALKMLRLEIKKALDTYKAQDGDAALEAAKYSEAEEEAAEKKEKEARDKKAADKEDALFAGRVLTPPPSSKDDDKKAKAARRRKKDDDDGSQPRLPGLEGKDNGGDEPKGRKRAKKSGSGKDSADRIDIQDDSKDWGITQPELGF